MNQNIRNVVNSALEGMSPDLITAVLKNNYFLTTVEEPAYMQKQEKGSNDVQIMYQMLEPNRYTLIDCTKPMITDDWHRFQVYSQMLYNRFKNIPDGDWLEC